MGLQDELDERRVMIRTESYSMSLGELISMYQDRELDIHPEFQRFFRWTDFQKSRFIESMLLGIPIPPIFVQQREDGVWDVIDGLQRLSTAFEFAGILRDDEDNLKPRLALGRTTFLPSLEGKVWGKQDEEQPNSLDTAQRLYMKRCRFDMNIILRDSDDMASYEMFLRLNTGGSSLSDQEVRNAILVQKKPEMFRAMRELADFPDFVACTIQTERALLQQFDVELVLRFLVFRRAQEESLRGISDLGQYLTDRMLEMAGDESYDIDAEAEAFREVFSTLRGALDEDPFRKYDAGRKKFTGGFSVSAFEIVALGLGYHSPLCERDPADILAQIQAFWTDIPAAVRHGSGIAASTRIPTTIPAGRRIFGGSSSDG